MDRTFLRTRGSGTSWLVVARGGPAIGITSLLHNHLRVNCLGETERTTSQTMQLNLDKMTICPPQNLTGQKSGEQNVRYTVVGKVSLVDKVPQSRSSLVWTSLYTVFYHMIRYWWWQKGKAYGGRAAVSTFSAMHLYAVFSCTGSDLPWWWW